MLKRVVIVVGEQSGDILGAGLIAALKKYYPSCEFEGIGGERMIAEGFHSFYPLDRLAVMGFVEPFKRLPELLSMRKAIKQHCLKSPPDVFIGIDSPDFNLNLARFIKHKVGVPVVHYVSPSVWAWRKGRIKGIKKSIDLMLTLFPFESAFYCEHNVKNVCVGHPLADDIPLYEDTLAKRKTLNLSLLPEQQVVALLPGSRRGEVEHLCLPFLEAASVLYRQNKSLLFILPAANQARFEQIEQYLQREEFAHLPVTLLLGQSRDVIAASDAIFIASGTATLEALLLKKPMVIAYRTSPTSYFLLRRLVKTPFIGLPNILSAKALVPELLQNDVTADNLSKKILPFLTESSEKTVLLNEYDAIHRVLKRDASQQAAHAIIELISSLSNK